MTSPPDPPSGQDRPQCRYLTLDELLRGAKVVLDEMLAVRDVGLLESALARPQASVLGEDAYPSFHEKAAALLHSLVTNHALIDGNKRLGFAATNVFGRLNGYVTDPDDEEAWFELIVGVADGSVGEVSEIAARLGPLLRGPGPADRPVAGHTMTERQGRGPSSGA